MLVIIATVEAKAGKEQQLGEILKKFVAPTRSEAGCIQYDVHVDLENPGVFIFYERWVDQAALDLHFKMPYIIEGFEAMAEITEGDAIIGKYALIS
jgi:quinol monooxygenase YgiN